MQHKIVVFDVSVRYVLAHERLHSLHYLHHEALGFLFTQLASLNN
jgi:hypothetical protein